jgi:hypothetical protein
MSLSSDRGPRRDAIIPSFSMRLAGERRRLCFERETRQVLLRIG